MRGVPDAGLVIEDVIAPGSIAGRPPLIYDSLHPLLLEGGTVAYVGVRRVVVLDGLISGCQNAVAGVGKPLPIISGLRPIFAELYT